MTCSFEGLLTPGGSWRGGVGDAGVWSDSYSGTLSTLGRWEREVSRREAILETDDVFSELKLLVFLLCDGPANEFRKKPFVGSGCRLTSLSNQSVPELF